jgi:MEMO1 family protein
MKFFSKITMSVLLAISLPALTACADIRETSVAGKFYPASEDALKTVIERLYQQAAKTAVSLPQDKPLRALIMPHAGYIYSGYTAAHAGLALAGKHFKNVIILGPDHHAGFTGCAISAADAYQTPLGKVELHPDIARLREQPDLFCVAPPVSEKKEHSLEVILPFLQTWLKDFQIMPILVGKVSPEKIVEALSPFLRDDTLLVVSSDLSHYLPYDQARSKDRQTLDMIAQSRPDKLLASQNRACGKIPISALLYLAKKYNWKPVFINYTNSGDTAGNHNSVVGYSTIAFYGGSDMATKKLTKKQGQALVKLARKTIFERLGLAAPDPDIDLAKEKALQRHDGTFVTLTINDTLRGCIGSLTADEPITNSVRRNAINAAFHDPRFPPLTQDEARGIAVEVSVLTEPQLLEYDNPQDLLGKLCPDIDGVIIKKGLSRATFLPQVWEQLPDRQEFLSHLCSKAGLAENCWEEEALQVYTYQAQYFESSH